MFAATGIDEILAYYVVYIAEHLFDRWISGVPLQTIYNRSKSGWSDAVTMKNGLSKSLSLNKKYIDPKVVVVKIYFSY